MTPYEIMDLAEALGQTNASSDTIEAIAKVCDMNTSEFCKDNFREMVEEASRPPNEPSDLIKRVLRNRG